MIGTGCLKSKGMRGNVTGAITVEINIQDSKQRCKRLTLHDNDMTHQYPNYGGVFLNPKIIACSCRLDLSELSLK